MKKCVVFLHVEPIHRMFRDQRQIQALSNVAIRLFLLLLYATVRLSDGLGWCTRAAAVGRRSSAECTISPDEAELIAKRIQEAQELDRIEAIRVKLVVF